MSRARSRAKTSERHGMQLARWHHMAYTYLRTAFAAVLVVGPTGACSRPAGQPRVIGPVIGESTAPGPANPSIPPPDATGPTEVTVHLHGTPLANPPQAAGAPPSATGPTTAPTTAPTTEPTTPAVVWAPSLPASPPPPNPPGGAGGGQQPSPSTPPANRPAGPVPVPPIKTAPPPPGTPPLAPPNGPGSGARPGMPRAAGPTESSSRGGSGLLPSTPGGGQR